MNAKQIAKDYFKSYPSVDEFYFTSDGQAFFTDNDARAHAHGLANSEVTKVTRDGDSGDAPIDLTSKVVYVDDADTIQDEDAATAKIIEVPVSASEKEAVAGMDVEKVDIPVEPSQKIVEANKPSRKK